jgi:predicted phage terminase large subunit-like protein
LEIYLPSYNSTIKFSHLQYDSDVNSHLGAQYSVIYFDEATLFDFHTQIMPLMGRLRNARVDYKPQMFWATNPMYGHPICEMIKDFYLDAEGIPIQERSNVEKYWVMVDGKFHWYDTMPQAEAIHGKGIPRSFRAIRSHVTQNIPLMTNNPDYYYNLLALPPVKRRIFLDGSWFSRESESSYYLRSFSEIVPVAPYKPVKRTRSWDTAATEVSQASPDPDWTRGSLVSKDKDGYITIEDVQSIRARPHKVEELIIHCAMTDPPGTYVSLNIDPGSSGLAYVDHLRKRLADMGVYCKVVRSNKNKLQRFLPFAAIAEAGYSKVVAADWNEDWFEEAERFNGQKHNGHDDFVDSVALAVETLSEGLVLPESIILPDLSTNVKHFGFQDTSIPSELVMRLN